MVMRLVENYVICKVLRTKIYFLQFKASFLNSKIIYGINWYIFPIGNGYLISLAFLINNMEYKNTNTLDRNKLLLELFDKNKKFY